MRRALPLVGLIIVYAKIVLTEAHLAPLDSDEGMYSGAAWCVATGQTLYRDVVFTQTPGAAWLYAGLIKTFGYSLLGMRLLNGLFVLVVPTLAAVIVQRHSEGDADIRRRAGLVAFALIAFSDFFLKYNVIARNYAPALACALAATLLALEAVKADRSIRYLLLTGAAGLCLGLAVTFKHSMVVLAPILFVAVLRGYARPRGVGTTNLSVCLIGGIAAGLVPTLWSALCASDAFLFGTYGIHQLIADWRIETHHAGTGMANKVWIWLGSLVWHGWVISAPALVVLLTLALLRLKGHRRGDASDSAKAHSGGSPSLIIAVVGLEAAALAALYFWLTPTWPDYATQVLPFLAVAATAGLVRVLARKQATIALLAMAILAVATNPLSLDRLITCRMNHPSQVARLEACGAWLREHARSDEQVLCVFPPYLLAAGRAPTFELAGGITAMNIADRLPEARRRNWGVMSAQKMQDRLRGGVYDWVVTGATTPAGLNDLQVDSQGWRLAACWTGRLAIYERFPQVDPGKITQTAPASQSP